MCGDSATVEPRTRRSLVPPNQALRARVRLTPQGLVRVPEPLELAREYQILIGLLVPVAVRVTARGIRHNLYRTGTRTSTTLVHTYRWYRYDNTSTAYP